VTICLSENISLTNKTRPSPNKEAAQRKKKSIFADDKIIAVYDCA